jgi:hypothetical protein
MFVSDYRNARIAIFVFSLQECGRLRDEILSELGVRLEDRDAQACVKLLDRLYGCR